MSRAVLSSLLAFAALALVAQAPAPEPKPNRSFTLEVEVPRPTVKSQDRSGTCWAFATTSFFESELMRLGKGDVGLSEMYVIRRTWPRKGWFYFRQHGSAPWSPGGQAHDWIETARLDGLMPREAYTGLLQGETTHVHGEMDAATKGVLDAALKARSATTKWPAALEGVLDAYLGRPEASFTFRGKRYTPASFRDSLGLQLDDYVELTSFSHHPFHQAFRLEIPDNWSQDARYHNLPLDELEQVMVHALKNGYSFVWDGDVSEKDFAAKALGYAFVPKAADQKNEAGKPEAEPEVTQELRQRGFDTLATTDDHLMHVVGLAKDQAGTPFFLTKNSWGERIGPHKGYLYMSRAYVRLKTVAILVHRKALPEAIARKLGLK